MTEAIAHLRHNTEFAEVMRYLRAEHAKQWRHYCRDPDAVASEYARGRASMLAELFKKLSGKDIIDE